MDITFQSNIFGSPHEQLISLKNSDLSQYRNLLEHSMKTFGITLIERISAKTLAH